MTFFRFPLGLTLALSLFMSTVVPSNVQAVTTQDYKMTPAQVSSSVEEVFQRFQYAMAVEWDQKDEVFKQQAERDLVKGLLILIETGVSLEEIQSYMQRTLLSEQTQKHYQRLVDAMRGQNLSAEEITAKTMDFITKNNYQGLSFNGEGGGGGGHGTWTLIVVVVIVVVVTQLCLKGSNGNHHNDHDDWDHGRNY